MQAGRLDGPAESRSYGASKNTNAFDPSHWTRKKVSNDHFYKNFTQIFSRKTDNNHDNRHFLISVLDNDICCLDKTLRLPPLVTL